jgi:hypothetical protein
MRKLIPLLAMMLMAGSALVASGATYTDNFDGPNPSQFWAVQDQAGAQEIWTPMGGPSPADRPEFSVSYPGMARITDTYAFGYELFLGSILASPTGQVVYNGGATIHGRVNAGGLLTGHGLALAAMFQPGAGGTWSFYTMNIAPYWHDISIGCYKDTYTWFRCADWNEAGYTPGVDMWTNPIDLTMQVQTMPNSNISFIGVAYGDLADGQGYRKICELNFEVGADSPNQYQIGGVSQPGGPPYSPSLVPKLTVGGVGFGGGLEQSWAAQGKMDITFDNYRSWDPLPGDANIDGVVDNKDASALGMNWLVQSGATWFMGDFNFDKKVDDQDAAILAAHWGDAAEGSAGSVPEPSTVVLLLGAVLAGLLGWRRR